MGGLSMRIPLDPVPVVRVHERNLWWRGARQVVIEVPVNYPGLTDAEHKELDEGLEKIKKAFLNAKERLERR